MIKTQNLVPEVYYNRSRDFQLIGRVYDIVFNYLKTNIDTISNLPNTDEVDDKLVNLVSTTLGFKEYHSYNVKQLKALCSIFTVVIRNKGNIQSIQYVLDMLCNIENSSTKAEIVTDTKDIYNLKVFIPQDISDTTLFQDILNYILPAGMSCTIIQEMAAETYSQTSVDVVLDVEHKIIKSGLVSQVKKAKLNDDTSEIIFKYYRPGVVQDGTVVSAGQENIEVDDVED